MALLGLFLIPIAVSTLRGLTHVLTCSDQVETPFSFVIGEETEPPVGISATRESREKEEETLCGGLTVALRARPVGPERVAMTVPVTNHTEFPWHGTVLLRVGGTDVPVAVERIAPGATASDTIELRLDRGQHELTGSLFIGP
jgi:hypothetical protein